MTDLLDLAGAVGHQSSHHHSSTGTQVGGAQRCGAELFHALKYGHLTVHLHAGTHLAQLVHIAEAVVPHALGDGAGALSHAQQHTHQGLHIGGEAGVRHGVDLQRQNIAGAGYPHSIVKFFHSDPSAAQLGRDGLQVLGGDVLNEHIAAGGSSSYHIAAGFDLIRDDAVGAAVHFFHAAHLDDVRTGTAQKIWAPVSSCLVRTVIMP